MKFKEFFVLRSKKKNIKDNDLLTYIIENEYKDYLFYEKNNISFKTWEMLLKTRS